jgi:predicted DCC family thiol-disulfide oxidoreductase YuxK
MPPKLVYDDDCRFCTWSATYAVKRSDVQPVRLSRVQNGESRLSDEERERLPDGYEECAQLITDDAVYSCGAATGQSLVLAGTLPKELVHFLRQFEDYERLREGVYHFLSDNRDVVANVVSREPPVSQHVSEADVHPEMQSRQRQ